MKRLRIIVLTSTLNRGGAQRQMVELAKGLHRRGDRTTVITFYPNGPFVRELDLVGVPWRTLHKSGRWDLLGFFRRALDLVRQERADVLYSFLTVPNILAALLKPLCRSTRMVWGLRSSKVDLSQLSWLARRSLDTERLLSRFPDLIIANSHAGRDYATSLGFPQAKMIVIPNGIDTNRFRPHRVEAQRVRAEWDVADCETLIGLVARLHPAKDHRTFLRAAALMMHTHPRARFACVGDGPGAYRQQLETFGESLGLRNRVVWAGPRPDMTAVNNAFNIATSSSAYIEGCSNAIAEAMACGVPCVVTDVGDSARLVADTGIVVLPEDPEALAEGWTRLLERDHREMGLQARARIVGTFGVDRMVERTKGALEQIALP